MHNEESFAKCARHTKSIEAWASELKLEIEMMVKKIGTLLDYVDLSKQVMTQVYEYNEIRQPRAAKVF